MNNIEILNETLRAIEEGGYLLRSSGTDSEEKVRLKLSKKQMSEAIVLTEEEVHGLIDDPPDKDFDNMGRCLFTVSKDDSFAAAIRIAEDHLDERVLVLNFANPVHPGGGVRRGAKAQEEDLCRKSTLLASLESSGASKYYRYNRNNNSFLGSDYMVLSPMVEIIRDEHNAFMEETIVVSVLTCAAPYLRRGLQGVSREELEKVIFRRIMGMLIAAIKYSYDYLVLGAWGCGAFANDAQMVAGSFYKAFKEIRCGELTIENALFRRVEFAVLYNPRNSYNYDSFYKYFNRFYGLDLG